MVSRELPLTTTDRVTEDDIYVTFYKKHLDFYGKPIVAIFSNGYNIIFKHFLIQETF